MRPVRRRAGLVARTAALGAVFVLALVSIGGCGTPLSFAGAHSAFDREMDESMARMMKDMHAPSHAGNVDVDFLAMMIPHHAGAVDMARLLLQHGHDPATRQLAEEIIAGQTVEIESMTRRLAALRRGAAAEFPSLGGTRGP